MQVEGFAFDVQMSFSKCQMTFHIEILLKHERTDKESYLLDLRSNQWFNDWFFQGKY